MDRLAFEMAKPSELLDTDSPIALSYRRRIGEGLRHRPHDMGTVCERCDRSPATSVSKDRLAYLTRQEHGVGGNEGNPYSIDSAGGDRAIEATIITDPRVYEETVLDVHEVRVEVFLEELNMADCLTIDGPLHRNPQLVVSPVRRGDHSNAFDDAISAQRMGVPCDDVLLSVVGDPDQAAVSADDPDDVVRLELEGHLRHAELR